MKGMHRFITCNCSSRRVSMMRMQRSSMHSADDSMSPLWSTKKARIWRTSFVKWTLNFDVFLKMFPCFRMSYGVIVSLNWKTLIVRKKIHFIVFQFLQTTSVLSEIKLHTTVWRLCEESCQSAGSVHPCMCRGCIQCLLHVHNACQVHREVATCQ